MSNPHPKRGPGIVLPGSPVKGHQRYGRGLNPNSRPLCVKPVGVWVPALVSWWIDADPSGFTAAAYREVPRMRGGKGSTWEATA